MSRQESNETKRALIRLIGEWERTGKQKAESLDALQEGIPRGVLTAWFSGYLRGIRWWREWVGLWCTRPPAPVLQRWIHGAMATVWNSDPEDRPIQVNDWVRLAGERFSKKESGLLNALLRRMLREGEALLRQWEGDPRMWGLAYSHPDWLVERWVKVLGEEETKGLLIWNQSVPPLYLRWYDPGSAPPADGLEPTSWEDFHRITGDPSSWMTLLEAGRAYVQDPATRIAPDLLQPSADSSLLELCAAPGGKTLALAARRIVEDQDRMEPHVAVDLPGSKIKVLAENLRRYPFGQSVEVLPSDVLRLTPESFRQSGLPTSYHQVFLDAPCSNSGVIARKPDLLLRLQPEDFSELTQLQVRLLEGAASFVKPGGSLVYSTCSFDPEENEGVLKEFLEGHPDWSLISGSTWLPHHASHDGGGAYLLSKRD